MAERKVFQSFKTYGDTEPIVSQLTDEEAGRIFKACYACYFRGETLKFRPEDDRMFRGAWGTFELKLLSEREKDAVTSELRSSAGKQGGEASARNKKQKQANAPTYTDTVTETISSTTTNSFTVTDTEQTDAASDFENRQSASAAAINAEPPSGDLFSLKQLISTAKRNKVKLTSEGIEVFYEEMKENGWMLYGKPVEKKGIVKTIRGWAKYHPEYNPEEQTPIMLDEDEEIDDAALEEYLKNYTITYMGNNFYEDE